MCNVYSFKLDIWDRIDQIWTHVNTAVVCLQMICSSKYGKYFNLKKLQET